MAIPTRDEIDLMYNHCCKAVGDPTRIALLYAIHEQARNVTALAQALDTPQPTVSRHLALLKQRGMVIATRDGASVIYSLADDRVIDVLNLMRSVLHDSIARHHDTIDA